MKIVMILGQNHRGSTYHMGRISAEKLTNTASITEFFFSLIRYLSLPSVRLQFPNFP